MKQMISIVGILLIIFGIGTLAYQGFTYTKHEKIAQIGPVEVSADKEKTVYFPPILGGLSLVVGVVLVIAGRNSKV